MRLEGLRQLIKNPTTSSGIEPATFRVVTNINIISHIVNSLFCQRSAESQMNQLGNNDVEREKTNDLITAGNKKFYMHSSFCKASSLFTLIIHLTFS
jgi:hypothetical protein